MSLLRTMTLNGCVFFIYLGRLIFNLFEQNGNSLNVNSPSNTYITAMIFSLAHPYGTPTYYPAIMDLPTQTPERLAAVSRLLYMHTCWHQFSTQFILSVRPGVGMCTGTCGKNGWLCQHRWTAISGMTGFRNAVDGAPITDWVSPQSNRISFGRGKCLSLRSYLAILTGHLRFGWLRRHQQ